MPRRPALGPATAALCAVLALTACQGSPEAGRPNTAPPTTTPTPSTASTPGWTPEEQAAIDAAVTRYKAARTAIDAAMNNPAAASHTKLENAGNGGAWLTETLGELKFNEDHGWYVDGKVIIVSTS